MHDPSYIRPTEVLAPTVPPLDAEGKAALRRLLAQRGGFGALARAYTLMQARTRSASPAPVARRTCAASRPRHTRRTRRARRAPARPRPSRAAEALTKLAVGHRTAALRGHCPRADGDLFQAGRAWASR